MNSFYKLAAENDFFCLSDTNFNLKMSSLFLQVFERQQTQEASVRDIFRSRFLVVFVSKRHISLLIK